MEELKGIMNSGTTNFHSNLILSTIHSSKGLEYERVYLADVLDGILPGMEELTQAMRLFADRCIDGIEADASRCRSHLENSVALITALSHLIGYDRAAEIAKQALRDNDPIKKALLEAGLFTQAELDALLRPEALTRPGMIKKPSAGKSKEAPHE